MRRFACIKFLTFSIISLLSCVLFSADTKAIVLTTELAPTNVNWENPVVQCISTYQGSWIDSSTWTCPRTSYSNSWDGDTYAIRTKNTYPVQEGYYYQIQIVLRNPNILPDLEINPIFWNFMQNDDFTPIALEVWYEDNKTNVSKCEYTYNGSQIRNMSCSEHKVMYNAIYTFTMQAKSTKNAYFQVGSNAGVLVSANKSGTTGPTNYNYTFGMKKIVEFKPAGSAALDQKDDEDRENIESQQESSSYDSGESASEATETGTTLLAAFSAFVSALTSATPSNCTLDMDLGNLDMGEVDFCELDPPAGFSALASVFLILFCVPLSIATARKIINLFRSFQ